MKKSFAPAVAVLFASAAAASAQMEMPGSPAGVNAALTKLFGDVKAFSAKAAVQVLDKNQAEKISTPMDFALLDGKIRVEVDISRVKNRDVSASAMAGMKQFGMDRVVSIVRPDKMASYIIFPGIQSYVNMPLPKADRETYVKTPRIEKTPLGKETLDGHPCVKNKVVMTDDQGRKHEATVWNASDLKDFPVQIQTREKEDTVVMRYRQIQLAKPDVKKFEPPADFKAYDDMTSLMQGAMTRAMNSGGSPPK
jgi:hypothetical protein